METNEVKIKKGVIRNTLTFQLEPSDMEAGGGLSQTQPDEALSIRQIIARFTRGQGSGVAMREGHFDEGAHFDTPDMSKLDHMDLIDRDEFARTNAETRERLEREIREEKDRKDKKAAELAQEDEELRKELRERRKKGNSADNSAPDDKPKG